MSNGITLNPKSTIRKENLRMNGISYNSKFRHHKLSTDINLVIEGIYDKKEQLKRFGYVHQLVFITPVASDNYIELMFEKLSRRHNGARFGYYTDPIYVKRVGVRTYFWFSFKNASERAAFVNDMEQRRRLITGKLFYLDFDSRVGRYYAGY